jgi:hypothetical protein
LSAVFSVREQQILRQIEDGLRADDRRFSRRFTLHLGVLRCSSPLRRTGVLAAAGAVLLAFAVLTAAAAAARTLAAAARIALHSATVVLEAIRKKTRLNRDTSAPRTHPAGRA